MTTQATDKYGNDRISIRGLQHSAFASEETNCYGVTIYLDGKQVGMANNQGQGGNTFLYPCVSGKGANGARAGLEEAQAYAASLPALPAPFPAGPPMPMTLDLLIDLLVEDELAARAAKKADAKLRKLCITKTVFRTPDMPEGEYRVSNNPYTAGLREFILSRFPDAIILNETL